MRVTVAFLAIIGILALGFVGLSMQSAAVEDTAVANGTNATQDAYNVTDFTVDVSSNALATMLVWGGFIAVALFVMGMVYLYAFGGGR